MSSYLTEISWVRTLALTGKAREIRQRAHISIVEMAQALGVNDSELSRWERGIRRPGPELSRRWAKLLRQLLVENASVGA